MYIYIYIYIIIKNTLGAHAPLHGLKGMSLSPASQVMSHTITCTWGERPPCDLIWKHL